MTINPNGPGIAMTESNGVEYIQDDLSPGSPFTKIDPNTGFGYSYFKKPTNQIASYFIEINGKQYPIRMDQIPLDITHLLGLNPIKNLKGAGETSFESKTGLIVSTNNSIMSGPYTKFDPISRYGYSSKKYSSTSIPIFFKQDNDGSITKVESGQIPKNVMTLFDIKVKPTINVKPTASPSVMNNYFFSRPKFSPQVKEPSVITLPYDTGKEEPKIKKPETPAIVMTTSEIGPLKESKIKYSKMYSYLIITLIIAIITMIYLKISY